MQVTVTTLSDEVFTIEVSEDLELENFKALCEFETGIPAREIAILWNGRPLHDGKTSLKAYGIRNNDILLLQHMRGVTGLANPPGSRSPNTSSMMQQRMSASGSGTAGNAPMIDFGSIQIPGTSAGQAPLGAEMSTISAGTGNQNVMEDPKLVREMFLSNPHELALLKERNPPLAEALASGSFQKFAEVFRQQQSERMEKAQERMRLMSANPFNPEVQKMIAEEIRLKNVENNMETAMEFAPESFGQVHMLYIDCNVNGHPVKAFVDSGAQMTIMSQNCAERCNIMRLVDTRWAGIAKGVGTQKIIGRVHLGQIQIGPDFLQSSFSILEDQPMDMLLGLDMLRRHQCSIELKRNVLVIGTTGTETPFLSESELPDHARLRPSMDVEDQQLAEALARSAEDNASKNESSKSIPTGSTPETLPASTRPAPPNPPPPPPPPTPQQTFPDDAMMRLMSYGFERQQVLDELRRANGDADQALAALLAKSLQMP